MRTWKRTALAAAALSLLLALPAGCGQSTPSQEDFENAYIDQVSMEDVVEIEDEAVAMAEAPTPGVLLTPTASGTKTESNSKATVDYSNTGDGYVMAKFTASTNNRLKVKVIGPTTEYTYDLPAGQWTTFPLSDGNGKYQVKVYEGTGAANKYKPVLSASFSATLTDEFAPFIRPNQYVNYSQEISPNTIAKAAELVGSETDALKKVEKVYDFVVNNLTYDYDKASNVKSGYLPVLDDVLAAKTGICFDYASLMTGMLRSQGVPCKLIVGYAGTAYHAWINVWSEENGWVDGAIFFDGTTWQRMDPTFASSSKGSQSIMKFIGDGKNYSTKYIY